MNFLDVKTDFAFKKVFGSEGSKDILLSFLNAVIEFDGGRKIADLTIVDPYNIPMLKGMKDTYVDVKAQLDDGSRVIIEMQVLNHEGFEKRVLYNAAKHYSAQLLKGEAYHLLNPVIALTLTDFVLFDDTPKLINCFKLLEKERFIRYSGDIELIFIELPKFTKTEEQLQNLQDKWIFFVKNAGSLEYVPKNLERELQKAFAVADEANLSTEELELQHRKRDWIYIQKSSIELALKQGIAQNQRDVILNARRAGLPVETIAAIVKLDPSLVENILTQAGVQGREAEYRCGTVGANIKERACQFEAGTSTTLLIRKIKNFT